MPTTFEKTWQKLPNLRMSTASNAICHKNFIFFLKAFLCGQYPTQSGWTGTYTVVSSSDGAAFGATDYWAYPFDSADIVQATAGSNHSWVVLSRSIGGVTWHIIIDCDRATTYYFDIVIAKTAPTGGSLTARPTSTDEVVYSNQQFMPDSSGQYAHGALTTDGMFLFMNSAGGQTLPRFGWFLQGLAAAKAADLYPVVSYLAYDAGNGPFYRANLASATYWRARKFDGTTTLSIGALAMGCSAVPLTAGWVMESMLVDGTVGKFADLPIFVAGTVAGNYSLKGRLYDLRWAPVSLNEGFVEPNPTDGVSSKFEAIWTPFSTPIIL